MHSLHPKLKTEPPHDAVVCALEGKLTCQSFDMGMAQYNISAQPLAAPFRGRNVGRREVFRSLGFPLLPKYMLRYSSSSPNLTVLSNIMHSFLGIGFPGASIVVGGLRQYPLSRIERILPPG